MLLVKAAKDRGIPLRQSYLRVGKKALIMNGRYAHARQIKRAKREQKTRCTAGPSVLSPPSGRLCYCEEVIILS